MPIGLHEPQKVASADAVGIGSLLTKTPRLAGVLLHPTSLPGDGPIGDFGDSVLPFLDWTEAAGFGVWQVLPLGPPAVGDSPYSCLSAFAGNPLLIGAAGLLADGLLVAEDLADAPPPRSRVDFVAASAWKSQLLRRAWHRLPTPADHPLRQALTTFCHTERGWLDDWALFAVLRRRFDGAAWWQWGPALARREPAALRRITRALHEEVDFERFVQFVFDRQWQAIRAAARQRKILVLGDLPIYVARDSADVWSHPALFELDAQLEPTAVAGCPPDYFTADGQLWGNPLYDWAAHQRQGYRWWISRLRRNLALADAVRLDHFRGFAGYWRIPADAPTARSGAWASGPGRPLFDALTKALGPLPLVAEDLGEITDDVHQLRRALALPCMRVLQFGFDEVDGDHAPHRVAEDTVVFTGTHDNDTTAGWWRHADPSVKQRYRTYTGLPGNDIARELLRVALTSRARWAIAPLQDLLGLDSSARMNTPGIAEGNWAWRLQALPETNLAAELKPLIDVSGRLPPAVASPAAGQQRAGG